MHVLAGEFGPVVTCKSLRTFRTCGMPAEAGQPASWWRCGAGGTGNTSLYSVCVKSGTGHCTWCNTGDSAGVIPVPAAAHALDGGAGGGLDAATGFAFRHLYVCERFEAK